MSYAAPKDGLPVFLVEETHVGHCRFYCPFCCEYHHHSTPTSDRPSNRVSHCAALSGYYIALKPTRARHPNLLRRWTPDTAS